MGLTVLVLLQFDQEQNYTLIMEDDLVETPFDFQTESQLVAAAFATAAVAVAAVVDN